MAIRTRIVPLLILAVVCGASALTSTPGPAQPPLPQPADPPTAAHLYVVKVGDKWGYIDARGAMVIAPRFDYAFRFSEGRAFVMQGDTWSVIDPTGTVLFKAPGGPLDNIGFVGGFARGSYWGAWPPRLPCHFFDRQGKVLPQRFAGIEDFSEGLAAVCTDPEGARPSDQRLAIKNGCWGYINATGELVIPARFMAAGPFSHGLAAVYVGGVNLMCTGLGGGKWGYIDRKGTIVIEPQFDLARPFSEGVACVGLVHHGRERTEYQHGYIGRDGKYVIPPFSSVVAGDFHEGFAAVRGPNPDQPQHRFDFGVINKRGDVVIPYRISFIDRFSGGLAAAQETKRDEQTGGWTQGKYGYLNPRGEWVIPQQYESASGFINGVAQVDNRKEGWGYIDPKGRRIWWSQK